MVKKRITSKGLVLTGRFPKAGITLYMRQGQVVARSSSSYEKRSNTLPQFIQRQKMLSFCRTMFTERQTAYLNFMSLANRLPAVYVQNVLMDQASFLMPGIPVSDGKLPAVKQELGEVNGIAALITDFVYGDWQHHQKLWLYTAVQNIEGPLPRVRFNMREVSRRELTEVNGHLALVNEEFADETKGWALVKVIDDRCSPQTIVTRCTLYQQYTTEEALNKAAESYHGLTDPSFLKPR